MDGCNTMSRGHNGVKKYFKESCSSNLYLHCRNQQLALFFCYLIPKHDTFKQFDVLLLTLWLILKNSSVRQSIFDKVQKAYELTSLKLKKSVFSCWLCHRFTAERLLNYSEPLVAMLDTICFTKNEPAVWRLRYNFVKSDKKATLCFLAVVIETINVLQTVLPGARLNFLQLPSAVHKLIHVLEAKTEIQ